MPNRWLLCAALIAALMGEPGAALAQEAPSDTEGEVRWEALAAGAFFPSGEDAAGTIGYAVLDDPDGAPFWRTYVQVGGYAAIGQPVSRPFTLPDALAYQVFEYGTLRWLPGSETAELADTLDLLWAAGREEWLSQRGVPAMAGPDADPLTRVGWLTDDVIRDAYFAARYPGEGDGFPAALARYGLPASAPQEREGSLVQRFDKALLTRDLATDALNALPVGTLLRDSGLLPASVLAPDRTIGGVLVPRAPRSVLAWPNARGWGISDPVALLELEPVQPPDPAAASTPAPAATVPTPPAPTPRASADRAAATPTAHVAAPRPGAQLLVKSVMNQGRAEHVVIANEGTTSQELTGWSIRSGTGGQEIAFPAGYVLAPGTSVRLHSGSGASAQHRPPTDLFGIGINIWNNAGDQALLVDPTGRVVHQLSYGS